MQSQAIHRCYRTVFDYCSLMWTIIFLVLTPACTSL